MSYTGNSIEDLDVNRPAGTETVSVLDDAIREVKRVLTQELYPEAPTTFRRSLGGLNLVIRQGTYSITTNSLGNKPAGVESAPAVLEVKALGNRSLLQIYYALVGFDGSNVADHKVRIFVRVRYENAVWRPWIELPSAESISSYVDSALQEFKDSLFPGQSGDAPFFVCRAFGKFRPWVVTPPSTTAGSDTSAYKTGSFTRTILRTIITVADHGLRENDMLYINLVGAPSALYKVENVINNNNFEINLTGATLTNTAVLHFVNIQKAKNVASIAYSTSSTSRYVINFETPMEDEDYTLLGLSHHYPGAWVSTAGEDTGITPFAANGNFQNNTRYQAFLFTGNSPRFVNFAVFS